MSTPRATGTSYCETNLDDPATAGLSRVVVPTVLGDITVHVGSLRTSRAGPATLLLHGAAGSWTTWLPLIRAAHDASKPLPNIVALDLPGWGDSADLPATATVDAMVDAVAHVARSLGFTQWNVIGHSLGGHLALTLAARYPDRTRSVTAISATGPGALSVLRHPIRNVRTLPLLTGMLGAMRFLAILGQAGATLIRVLHGLRMLGALSAPLFAQRKNLHSSVINSLAAEIRPAAFVRAAEAAAEYDENQWATIRCPVHLIRGDRDVFVSTEDDLWFANILPQCTRQAIKDAGHFAHVESTELLAPAHGTAHVAA